MELFNKLFKEIKVHWTVSGKNENNIKGILENIDGTYSQ
jgi:hypothetical protein